MAPRSVLSELDPVISAPVRLAAIALLMTGAEVDFTLLRERLDLTNGNLLSHLRKLEEAGYIKARKALLGRRTSYRMTAKGRAAFERHVAALQRVVNPNAAASPSRDHAAGRPSRFSLAAPWPVKG